MSNPEHKTPQPPLGRTAPRLRVCEASTVNGGTEDTTGRGATWRKSGSRHSSSKSSTRQRPPVSRETGHAATGHGQRQPKYRRQKGEPIPLIGNDEIRITEGLQESPDAARRFLAGVVAIIDTEVVTGTGSADDLQVTGGMPVAGPTCQEDDAGQIRFSWPDRLVIRFLAAETRPRPASQRRLRGHRPVPDRGDRHPQRAGQGPARARGGDFWPAPGR
jgi:hypothetical protein